MDLNLLTGIGAALIVAVLMLVLVSLTSAAATKVPTPEEEDDGPQPTERERLQALVDDVPAAYQSICFAIYTEVTKLRERRDEWAGWGSYISERLPIFSWDHAVPNPHLWLSCADDGYVIYETDNQPQRLGLTPKGFRVALAVWRLAKLDYEELGGDDPDQWLPFENQDATVTALDGLILDLKNYRKPSGLSDTDI